MSENQYNGSSHTPGSESLHEDEQHRRQVNDLTQIEIGNETEVNGIESSTPLVTQPNVISDDVVEDEIPEAADNNLPTLIGDKMSGEVRNELGLEFDARNQFTPDQEKLNNGPWGDEPDTLPWEENVEGVQQGDVVPADDAQEETPVEEALVEEAPVEEAPVEMAFEHNDTVIHQPVKSTLPWEEKSELPWDQPEAKSTLPWETSENSEALPWEEPQNAPSDEPMPESVPEPVSEVVPEPVAEIVSEPVSEVVPEPVAEIVPEPVVEPVQELQTDSAFFDQLSQPEGHAPVPAEPTALDSAPVDPTPVVPKSEIPVDSITSQVNSLNLNDDDFFNNLNRANESDVLEEPDISTEPAFNNVDELEESEDEQTPEQFPKQPESVVSTESVLQSNKSTSKLSDFLADDELLDDEPDFSDLKKKALKNAKSLAFLENDDLLDTEAVKTEPKKVRQSKSYAPISQPKYEVPKTVNTPAFNQNLVQAKKKNDAYDFPIDLMPQAKPAPRSNPRYAPSLSNLKSGPSSTGHSTGPPSSAVSSNSGPISGPPKSHLTSGPPSTSSVPSINHITKVPSRSPKAMNVKPVVPKKSFFEELPIEMPPPAKKPARASSFASNKSINSTVNNSPNFSAKSPQLHKPPVNPYAKVQPAQPAQPAQNNGYQFPQPGQTAPGQNAVVPNAMAGPPPMGQGAHLQPPNNTQPFPSMNQGRKISNPSPNVLNTNLAKAPSQTSPYVPNSGPYAPSNHYKAHSRTSSLIGGKGKEVNPYAPALPPVAQNGSMPANGVPPNGPIPPPGMATGPIPPPGMASGTSAPLGLSTGPIPPPGLSSHPVPKSHPTPNRTRGTSNPKTGIYGRARAQSINKVQNPAALLKRQFPIFNWGNHNEACYLIPASVTSNYHSGVGKIQVTPVSSFFNDKNILTQFPGPLSKNKNKKKDVEKWLDSNIQYLSSLPIGKEDEILLNQVLLSLTKFDGDHKSFEFRKEVSGWLNPNVNFENFQPEAMPSMGVSPNASKLDASGTNYIFQLIQAGKLEEALQFTISKGDWALGLMLAASIGLDKFQSIASDYARVSFPFQKSNNKVHHMMPMVLKVIAGNYKSVIDDFVNVPSEGEWFSIHWRELVALVLINCNASGYTFFFEYGKYLKSIGNSVGSEICSILAGSPLTVSSSPMEGFSYVGTFTSSIIYSEIYEFIVCHLSTNPNPSFLQGFLHLLPLKLKHAQLLADYGSIGEAQKYCDNIGNTIKTTGNNPYFDGNALKELQKLAVRISESDSNEGGWFGSKISKVNLDKMWGQIDKFIGGEDGASKNVGENGVFSKFSPSVSRVGSVLDFTAPSNQIHQQLNQISPQTRFDNTKDPMVPSSAPVFNSKYSPRAGSGSNMKFQQPLVRTPMSEHVDNNSLFAVSPNPQGANFGNPYGKYAPSNGSSLNLDQQIQPMQPIAPNGFSQPNVSGLGPPVQQPVQQTVSQSAIGQPPLAQPPKGKYAPGRSKNPYQNPVGAISNLSVNSHQPMASSNLNPNSTHQRTPSSSSNHYGKRASVSSIVSTDNFINQDHIRGHNHSPSIQSDISLDYPPEFKARETDFNIDKSEISSPIKKHAIERIDEKEDLNETTLKPPSISEFNPTLNEVAQQPDSSSVAPGTSAISGASAHGPGPTPGPSGPSGPSGPTPDTSSNPTLGPPPGPKPGPPMGGARSRPRNAYAPGGAKGKPATTNKYGPSKYAAKESKPLALPEMSGDMFGFGGYEGSKNMPKQESKDLPENEITENKPESNGSHPQAIPPQGVPNEGGLKQLEDEVSRFETPKMFKSTNVDESFDDGEMNSMLETPKPRLGNGPLILNKSPDNKESMFSPYQVDSRRPSAFGIDSTFNEFPIPGSPMLSTRANSVINGVGGGLFSSRLSQSQQSAMYQQYEVQDDTVHDYVPVVEEEEEEDEEEPAQKSEKRKIEQEQKTKTVRHQPSRDGWFKWLKKDDGTPRPTQMHFGESNKLYYDEKHKRWLNRDIPIEEQLKSNAPPPPPKAKKEAIPAKPPGAGGPIPNRTPSGMPMGVFQNPVMNMETPSKPGPAPLANENAPINRSVPGSGPSGPTSSAPTSSGPADPIAPGSGASGPSGPSGAPPKPPITPKGPSLANAGLDDLLSLGGSTASVSSRKGRKTGRRGYVNVLEQKN